VKLLRPDDFFFPVKIQSINERLRAGEIITEATIEWADRVGLTGEGLAQSDHIRAAACGPFAALGWPGAAPWCAQIISDTVCAAFVIDDMCDGDVAADRRTDHGDIDALFKQITAFWYDGREAELCIDDPLHASWIDLRRRLVESGASAAWMERFARSFEDWLVAIKKEAKHKRVASIPGPDMLMDIRPDSGAAFVFMHFIERASGCDLSNEALHNDDIAMLNRLASRMAIYPNEVWSYQKESAHGHSINLVTSLMHHKSMSLKEAVVSVAETHNVEMLMFTDVARRVLNERQADPTVRMYIEGLQHFLHGLFIWGWHAGRYSRDFFNADHPPVSARASISHQRLRTFPKSLLNFASGRKT
jgi:hypothetical protein